MRTWLVLVMLLLAASASHAQLTLTFAGGKAGGVVPGACDGSIDLSTGCVQPMLGH